ncbi:MAG: alpha/beta hydrolase family protein [Pirellulaceae bacterium]|jgi:pimeloyl-ACP methyl ester carboxylesterase
MVRCKRGSWSWLGLLLVGIALGVGGTSARAQFQDDQEAAGLSDKAIQAVSGERSTWNGFSRIDFSVDGRKVTVVEPRRVLKGRPWVWHGEFFGHRPIPDVALLGRGHHIVFAPFSDQFGGPAAIAHWEKVYRQLVQHFSLSPQSALVGTSRGGLYCYNWAARYPERVSCIFGDAPVCDLKSWPLGMGTGTRNEAEVTKLLTVYGVEDVPQLLEVALNPIDRLQSVAQRHIPILHVSGDADSIVPLPENTEAIQKAYQALGGKMEVIIKPGIGHVHGLDDSTPIIEFIDRHRPGQG